ncbi:MAG: matrixin family metalloprotease [Candidatus Binatia bacterium]
MKARSWLAGFALCLAGAATNASAYVIDQDGAGHPLWWPSGDPIGYRMVANNVPAGVGGENAVHRAFASWSNASANIEYRFEGFADSAHQGNDGQNVVYWVHQGWTFDPALAAVTFRFYDTRNGRLVDADIVVNGERFTWSDGGSAYDIENSLAHEVGHFGGLGHSSDGAATMFGRTQPRETAKRSLEHDDLSGLDAIYGGVAGFVQTGARVASASVSGESGGGGGGGGGCAVSPVASVDDVVEWWPILTLLAVLTVRTRRRSPRAVALEEI